MCSYIYEEVYMSSCGATEIPYMSSATAGHLSIYLALASVSLA